jgi:aminopeptidase-like protein
MHALARRLWPICRSITGNGVRETLAIIGEGLPGLQLHEVPSGTEVFDWTVPDEWNITEAYIEGPSGHRIVDFADSNLHVVSYSVPVDVHLPLADLQEHLHSLPGQPSAIPYLTTYYTRQWGFCLTDEVRRKLPEGEYRAVIDATLEPGSLTYAELVIPGETDDEVFISTYVCHPSLANNELSGPVVSAAVAAWVAALPSRRFTYRFVFLPETIGSITYLSRNLEHLRAHVVAGLNLTCIGDERAYSYLPSRDSGSWVDRATRHVLSRRPHYTAYTFLDRGSDERQYCAPGVDLPVASVMRSKYGVYPEYHTSLDDLDFVTPAGLQGGFEAVCDIVRVLEGDAYYRVTTLGEPRLGKHGLYHSIGGQEFADRTRLISDIVAYADGQRSLLDMAELFGCSMLDMLEPVAELVSKGLLVHDDRRPGDRTGRA